MECALENITLHYEVAGEGRPILMLHGWPLDHRHMMAEMEPLFGARDGWRRIYPDLPGMGRTPGQDWITNQDQMLEIVLEFLDAVIPGERLTVAGASYGGYLARGLVYQRSARIDGLLLTVPVIRADESERELPPAVTLVEDPALMAELDPGEVEPMQGIAVVQSPELLEWLRVNVFPAIETADEAFLSRVRERYAFSFDVDALAEPFPGPALMVMGRQDAVCGYQGAWDILEHYPRATFAVLDRAGHGLAVEQRGVFSALAGDWLDRVEEYASRA